MLPYRLSRQSIQYTTRLRAATCTAITNSRHSFSTKVNSKTSTEPLNITLYQYATCPFCNRVKSYLDYVQLDYSVVEVNPMNKKELKPLNQTQVPVAVVNHTTIANSTTIIEQIHAMLDPKTLALLVNDEFMSDTSQKWSKWSEDHLAVVLYPNITRTLADSWAAFGYVSEAKEWSTIEKVMNRTIGPVAMYLVRNKIKQKYGIVVSGECLWHNDVM